MEQVDFRTAESDETVATLLRDGCVMLHHCIDPAALGSVYDMVVQGYEQVERKHIQPDQLRQLGLPMYSDLLFTPRHHDLLGRIFGSREYEIDSNTVSRRVSLRREPPHWGWPLPPHIDAFVNPLQFTVNFWIPFHECGVEAPSLGVIPAPFAEIVSFTGYQGGAEVWDDPAPVQQYSRFHPAMKAMTVDRDPALIAAMRARFADRIHTPSFVPGDAMLLTNWTLHFTHATPEMTKRRENVELRFSSPAYLDDILREHGIAVA